jgi:hypothetical protein
MAEAVSVDVQTVRRWLRLESTPTGDHLMAVLRTLDAPRELLDAPMTRGEALAMMVAYDRARRRRPQP